MVILVIKVRGYRLVLTTLEGAVALQRARAVEVDLLGARKGVEKMKS